MRSGQQSDQWTDAGAQTEEGVPLQPRLLVKEQLIVGPPEMANDPERHRDGDDVPEEPLTAGPLAAAANDHPHDEQGRCDEAGVAEDRQRKRPPLQRPAGQSVGQDERQPEREVPDASQGQIRCPMS